METLCWSLRRADADASGAAQEDTKKELEPPSPAKQYSELVSAFNAARSELSAQYSKATTAEDRAAVLKDMNGRANEIADKMLELANSHPDDRVAPSAVRWIIQYASSSPAAQQAGQKMVEQSKKDPKSPGAMSNLIMVATRIRGDAAKQAADAIVEIMETSKDDPGMISPLASLVGARGVPSDLSEKALATLMENFIDNDQLGPVCLSLGRSPESATTLRQIMEKSTNKNVQGHAMLALATSLLGYPVKPNKEAESLLEKLMADYGDIKSARGTLAELAEGPLFEIQHLQIGMAAPNIEGEDVDGEKFQLADYKGKVTVLDFWGDW